MKADVPHAPLVRQGKPSFPEKDRGFFAPMRLRFAAGDAGPQEPYRQHGWTYAVINAIARNIAQVPFCIYGGTEKDPVKIQSDDPGSEWLRLFDRPNPSMSRSEFWESILVWLSLSGECIVIKEPKGNDRRLAPGEMPFELWPTNGKDWDHMVDESKKRIVAWVHRPQGEATPTVYEPHEIIHLKYYNPYEPLRGLAPWEASELATRQDWKAARYNEAFFDNDASPGLVIMSQMTLDPETRAQIREAWQDRHQGYRKRRKLAIMEGGLDIKEFGATHREMEFSKLRDMALNELLAIYKVPKSEVAMHENLNYATAQSADKGFWAKTLIPIMKMIEDTLWTFLFVVNGKAQYWGEFDLSTIEALRENFDTLVNTSRKMLGLGYTLNMVNERMNLGMEEVDWGNQALMDQGLTPVEMIQQAAGALEFPPSKTEPALLLPGHEDEVGPSDRPAGVARPIQLPSGPGPEGVYQMPQAQIRELIKHRLERRRAGQKTKKWNAVVAAVMDPFEAKFRARFKRYLMELRTEQLKRIEVIPLTRSMVRATVDDSLFDRKKWDAQMRLMHRPLYNKIAEASVKQVFEELGGNWSFNIEDPKMLAIIKNREDIFVTSTNDTIRKGLARQMEEGLTQGESISQLQDRIRTTFNFASSRSLTIARTETAGMTNASRNEAMAEEGVEEHEWTTADDEVVRKSHEDQDGTTVKMGEHWPNGLLFPGDPDGEPGEIINCRCVAVPVV